MLNDKIFNLKQFAQQGQSGTYGFIHVAIMGATWFDILLEQLHKIEQSGLMKNTNKIFMSILGPDSPQFAAIIPDLQVICRSHNLGLTEIITLKMMKEFCRIIPSSKIWYIHTKGVSQPPDSPQYHNCQAWRRYMEHFNITQHRACVAALDNYDACGVEWISPDCQPAYRYFQYIWSFSPEPHFSGNFWWANSKYIASLPNNILRYERTGRFGGRWAAEYDFISRGNPKVKCFHWAGVQFYNTYYHHRNYEIIPYL